MRDREVIEREMSQAREDLEANLAELKHTVREKVDVKARARVAVEKGKLKAQDAFERGKDAIRDYAHRGRAGAKEYAIRGKEGARQLVQRGEDRAYFMYLKAKDRPVLTGLVIGGIVATGVLIAIGIRRNWWSRAADEVRFRVDDVRSRVDEVRSQLT
jgi:hypothetical protein